jgi:uncharacterized protein RhaS with RHS repeats
MAATTRGKDTVSYKYNGLGERVRKDGPSALVPSGTNHFVNDASGKLPGEYRADGTPIQEYVYLYDQPVAILRGSLAAPEVFFVYADHLNTPRVVTDMANRVRWRWDAPPFGEGLPDENPGGAGGVCAECAFCRAVLRPSGSDA